MFSALPFCIVLLTVRHVAGVNYNPNGSAFLWLPSDDYSGSNFFEWVIMYVERWCIFMVSLSAAGHFSVSKIQQSASLEMPPPHSFQVDGYWVHISVEMSSESCPSHIKPHLLITNACSFVNKSTAFANGLVSVQGDGKVIMKADDTSNLDNGVFRDRWVLVILFAIFRFLEGTFFCT